MEEKQIKMIQIAQAKARLENMQSQKAMLVADVSTYQNSKALIDDYLLKLQEEQYELKYTYTQQITDLETTISREGEKLQTRYDWWEITNQRIIDNSRSLITTLNDLVEEDEFVEMLAEYGTNVDDLIEKIEKLQVVAGERIGTYPTTEPILASVTGTLEATPIISDVFERAYRRLSAAGVQDIPKFKRGIEYVPETMAAMIHRGETISPAGRESPSGITIGSVIIEVKEIAEIDDIEKLNALLSQAESSGLMKRGKTNYRLRIG